MKIRPEHLKYLKTHLVELDPAPYVAAGLSAMRYRWDCLYKSKLSAWICDALYPYMSDPHLNTALRSIIDTSMFPGEQK